MLKISIFILLSLISLCGTSAYADNVFLSLTNLKSGQKKEYTLGKSMQIPIDGLQGWKSCQAIEPKSKYINQVSAHVRQHAVICTSDIGASVEIVCAIFDEKNSSDSASITLFSTKSSKEQVFIHLSCEKK
jgi:hypothetical protein